MKLYHYTCSDGLKCIRRDGFLKPHGQVVLGGVPLVWLTDLAVVDRAALGLWSHSLSCDRTEHRVEVETDAAMHWPRYARRFLWPLREQLEGSNGARPMHWYVSEQPVPLAAVLT